MALVPVQRFGRFFARWDGGEDDAEDEDEEGDVANGLAGELHREVLSGFVAVDDVDG